LGHREQTRIEKSVREQTKYLIAAFIGAGGRHYITTDQSWRIDEGAIEPQADSKTGVSIN
jgi:hypothetical protein